MINDSPRFVLTGRSSRQAQGHQHQRGRAAGARQADGRSRHASAHGSPPRARRRRRLFNQGLTLVYGFNHGRAIQLFQRAAELDPRAPMPLWGIALAYGPNINDFEMDRERAKTADEFAKKALALTSAGEPRASGRTSRRWRSATRAIRPRISRSCRSTTRTRWRRSRKRYPSDLDAQVLYAREPDGPPAVAVVDARRASRPTSRRKSSACSSPCSKRSPLHPGANHYYIHTMEGSPSPEKALASAQASRNAGAGRRSPRAHAGAHLRAHRAFRGVGRTATRRPPPSTSAT